MGIYKAVVRTSRSVKRVCTAVTRIIRYVEREFKAEARTSWSI